MLQSSANLVKSLDEL